MSFQSSLQPMLSLIRCTGVYLESFDNKVHRRRFRCCTLFFSAIVFFINIFFNLLEFANMAKILKKPETWEFMRSQKVTSTKVWNVVIMAINYTFLTIGCHLSMLICAYSRKWLKLLGVLGKIEQVNVFDKGDFQTFRSIYVVGCGLVVTVVILVNVYIWTIGLSEYDLSFIDSIVLFLRFMLPIYMLIGGVMFCCLGWMAATQFTILAKRVKLTTDSGRYNKVNNWNKKIDTWRHHHFLISDLVDKISHLYGPFLLVFVTYSFVIMINSSFILSTLLLAESSKMMDFVVNGFSFVLQLSFFCSLTYVPHRLRESAIHFSKQLRTLQLDVIELQNKVNFLVVEVLQSLPKISALGLFDVNFHLIPTLAGTTLTYLIILFQFQFSEQ